LDYVEVLLENATKSVNNLVCILDLVIIKFFGNNNIEIKRIVFTYPGLLPSALVVELELILVYLTVGIHLLWKSCDVRPMSMASWNRGFCSTLFCSVMIVSYATSEITTPSQHMPNTF